MRAAVLAAALLAACAAASEDATVPKGSTPADVERILGKPDGKTEVNVAGRRQEVWIYGSRRELPRLPEQPEQRATPGTGPIFGEGERGMSHSAASYRETLRVFFESGRVVAVEKGTPSPGPP